jgi:hypothetical protein
MWWRSGNTVRLRLETSFAALVKLSNDKDINRASENIKEI